MIEKYSVSVVIPTLNEEQGIAETLMKVPSYVDEIIVVDGNSKDRTREIAAAASPKVSVILEKRKGYGRAFKTGFQHARGDLIATADGDGTYPIELLSEIAKKFSDTNLNFVSCSRFPLQEKSSMRIRNWIGNHGLTWIASLLFFHRFDDILSGMWVFRRAILQKLDLQSDSWNFSEEIKLEAFTKNSEGFLEVSVPYRERLGETKLVPWKVGTQNLVYMIAMRFKLVRFIRSALGRTLSGEIPV